MGGKKVFCKVYELVCVYLNTDLQIWICNNHWKAA